MEIFLKVLKYVGVGIAAVIVVPIGVTLIIVFFAVYYVLNVVLLLLLLVYKFLYRAVEVVILGVVVIGVMKLCGYPQPFDKI